MKKAPKCVVILSLLVLCGFAEFRQPKWPPTFMGRKVIVVKSPLGSEGEPLASAVICLRSTSGQQCYTPPQHDVPFGLSPKATVVRLISKRQALLFSADSSAGGSGSSRILALLVPGQGKYLKNLFPPIVVSEQSEHQFIYENTASDMPIFVVADYLWSDGETHFSQHRFTVSIYTHGKNPPHYQLRDKYVTTKKYSSFDEAESIEVIAHERPEILARLARLK